MGQITHTNDTYKEELVSQYITAVSTLEAIRDTESPTNEQVVTAVKYLAQILLLILRVLKNYYL